MYILNVEKRNESVKAKKLRKLGLIPVSMYGGDLTETLLMQTSLINARKLLKSKSKGGRVQLDFEGNTISALLKEISYHAVSGEVETLDFQKLLEDEVVNSSARIVIVNRDKTQLMVQQLLDEIPYRGLPSDLVETIEIDIETIKEGHNVKVEDLPFAKNERIEILMPMDALVLSMAENNFQEEEAPVAAEAEEN
ncbi:MAG: hypothetical protein RR131_05540 [Anaerovorax sp.]